MVVEKSGSDITKSEPCREQVQFLTKIVNLNFVWYSQHMTITVKPRNRNIMFLIRANDNCRNEGQTEIFPLLYSRSTEEKVSVTEPGSVIRTPTPNEGKSAAVTTGDVPCVLTQVKKGREVVH